MVDIGNPGGDATSPGTPSKPKMSAPERRDQIIESAHRVFARRGLAGSRTRDIAEEAGVNEALVYQHFRSKTELFEAVVESVLDRATARLGSDLQEVAPDRDLSLDEVKRLTARQVSELLIAFIEIEPLLGVVVYGADGEGSGPFRAYLDTYLRGTREIMQTFLPYWPHVEFETERAVEALLGMVWARVLISRLSGRTLEIERESEAIARMILEGLLAR